MQLKKLLCKICLVFWLVTPLAAQSADEEINSLLQQKDASEKSSGKSLLDRASIPYIFLAADMVGSWDLGNSRLTENAFLVRASELGLSAGIDQLAMGHFLLAMHNANGIYSAELHELYFEFNQLPLHMLARLGRFLPDFGYLNSIHPHDWAFTTAPRVQEQLFGPDGLIDSGADLSFLLPWSFYQEVKLGVFNGKGWGEADGSGINKARPLLTARLKNFFPLPGNWGLQLGFTYINYNRDANPQHSDISAGSDLAIKWRKGNQQSLSWVSELWLRQQYQGSLNQLQGFYSYLEYQPWQRWKLGARFDYFSDLGSGQSDLGQSLWLTFAPSEFSFFRLTVERQDYASGRQMLAHLQADFILGQHPAHRY